MVSQKVDGRRDARAVVEQIVRRYRSLHTAPVLDAAGELLDAWIATAKEHGGALDDVRVCGWESSLAVVAVEIAESKARETRPRTVGEGVALLDEVVVRLRARGVDVTREDLFVSLPRTERTPRWGVSGGQLALVIERGWEVVIDQASGSPVVEVVGACDVDGIEPMLDLLLAINDGARGNVFR